MGAEKNNETVKEWERKGKRERKEIKGAIN